MAETTQSTEPQPEPRATGDLLEEAFQVGWAVLGSSRTFMVLSALLSVVVLAGAAVEQAAGRAALLERHDWAVARAIALLGLDGVLTSWPFVLLILLLGLNGVGLFLRHRRLTPAPARARATWTGPTVARASGRLPGGGDAVTSAVARAAGVRKTAPAGDGAVVMRRGLWNEGLGLAILGLVILGAAVLTNTSAGLDARLQLIPGVDEPTTRRATVHAGDTWIERQLPFDVYCERADPVDPLRRRTCRVRGFMAEEPVTVGAGRADSAAGLTLRPLSERPRPGVGPPTLLLRRGEGSPEVLRAEDGRTYELADGTRITPFAGPDGPLTVVRPADGRPVLLTPALDRTPVALAGGLSVEGVPTWEVTLAVTADPARYLRWAALAFLILGLLAMGAKPHLGVVVVPGDGAVEVRAWSFNRVGTPGRLMLDLHALAVTRDAEEAA